jgi:hypothetical protein
MMVAVTSSETIRMGTMIGPPLRKMLMGFVGMSEGLDEMVVVLQERI